MKKIFSVALAICLAMGMLQGSLASAQEHTFVHCGTLHKDSDFERMKSLIDEAQTRGEYASDEAKTCLSGWNELLSNSYSNPDWTPRPLETVIR